MENVIKESAEEASVPAALAALARPVGAVRYICERTEGLRNDVAFSFDLALPADFRPQPNDGEVESFSLWPMAEVLERLRGSDDFKFNVALVNLHFEIGRAHVSTPVTNAHIVCRLLLEKTKSYLANII